MIDYLVHTAWNVLGLFLMFLLYIGFITFIDLIGEGRNHKHDKRNK